MYHLNIRWVRRSSTDSAMRRLEYVTRTGRYAKRPDKVRATYSRFMPAWAASPDASNYWQAADGAGNRVNARLLYVIEFALPRALDAKDQATLAFDFMCVVAQFSCRRDGAVGLPFVLVIHEGHGRNPHVHALVSTSINDGVQRSIGQWFKRADPKNPAAGGARRSRYVGTHDWLLRVRKTWAEVANKVLKAAGLEVTLDDRSYAARGLPTKPGMHLGPKRFAASKQDTVSKQGSLIELRPLAPGPPYGSHQRAAFEDAEARQLVDELEWARQSSRVAAAELLASLALHPFRDGEHAPVSATCFLLDNDAGTLQALKARIAKEDFCEEVMEGLGTEWICTRRGDELWVFCPPKDDVIVVGSGFLITDSVAEEVLGGFARLAGLLQLKQPRGKVDADLFDSVEAFLAARGVNVAWAGEWPRLKPGLRPP